MDLNRLVKRIALKLRANGLTLSPEVRNAIRRNERKIRPGRKP